MGLTLASNAILKGDPTRTTPIRNRFAAEARARFELIKSLITVAIVDRDALGLKPGILAVNKKRKLIAGVDVADAAPKQFAFPTSVEKQTAFMAWLREQTAAGVLGTSTRGPVGSVPWANTYIDSAYKKAIIQARTQIQKAGLTGSAAVAGEFGMLGATSLSSAIMLNQPVHAERVSLLYTRVFEDLKGITEVMATQISRELAQGLSEGRNPNDIARSLNGKVDGIGITRSRMLARTEVIRAHAEGTLTEFEAFGIAGVEMGVEFHTASDPCPECEALAGELEVLSIADARGIIPVHVSCRCTWLPAIKLD